MKRRLLKFLVRNKRLTPSEKLASRIGYFGAGFLLAAHWTIEPVLYIVGFSCVLIQVASRKQWNLVALNINGLIAWARHLINSL
jgi:cytochrome c biogenesis protein CcdA